MQNRNIETCIERRQEVMRIVYLHYRRLEWSDVIYFFKSNIPKIQPIEQICRQAMHSMIHLSSSSYDKINVRCKHTALQDHVTKLMWCMSEGSRKQIRFHRSTEWCEGRRWRDVVRQGVPSPGQPQLETNSRLALHVWLCSVVVRASDLWSRDRWFDYWSVHCRVA